MTISIRAGALIAGLAAFATFTTAAVAQTVTLRVHQFLPAAAPIPKNFIAEWAKKVEQESGSKIKVELYPSMQLGGSPPQLYDQVKDGVVDIIWTLPGIRPAVSRASKPSSCRSSPATPSRTARLRGNFTRSI